MKKIYYILIFFFTFILNVKADHPLETDEDSFVSIKYEDEKVSFYFMVLETMDDGTSMGRVLLILGDSVGDFMFCAFEKESGVSDIYLIRPKDENFEEVELVCLLEVHQLPNHRVRVLEMGREDSVFATWDIVPNTPEIDEENDECKKSFGWKKTSPVAKDIATIYKNSGRKGVSLSYGKTVWEKISEKVDAEMEASESPKKKKKKSASPQIDKNGCIAYVDKPNLVKVVSKKATYKEGRIHWSCKVKNIGKVPVKTCFVEIKCYDKNGYEVVSGIEYIQNIAIGEARIISNSTTSISEKQAKKIKRYEFSITSHLDN